MKKLLYAIFIICAVGVIGAVAMRITFSADDPVNYRELDDYSFVADDGGWFENNKENAAIKYTSPEELLENASAIVIVEITGERTRENGTVLTQAIVKEVRSGAENLRNQIIDIYEPFDIIGGTIFSLGYNLMEPEKEYLVFLDEISYPQGYEKNKYEEMRYTIANQIFGKYLWKGEVENSRVLDSELTCLYGKVKKQELLTASRRLIQ